MNRVRVIPVLLLRNNGLVKTIQFKKAKYIGDPINAVKIFNDKEVDEIVLLDINATSNNVEPNYEKIKEICSEAFMPFAYGGGIHNVEQIKKLFNVGIEKVIINSSAYSKPELITSAAKIYGSQSIVVSVDVKKNIVGKKLVYTEAGTKNTRITPSEYIKMMEDYGAGEIILTSIDQEGTYKEYDLDLISSIAHKVSLPIVVNGGAASVDSFLPAIKAGASAVAAGSIFVYHSSTKGILINYPSQKELKEKIFSKI